MATETQVTVVTPCRRPKGELVSLYTSVRHNVPPRLGYGHAEGEREPGRERVY